MKSAQIPSASRTQKVSPIRECRAPSRPAFLPRSPPARKPASPPPHSSNHRALLRPPTTRWSRRLRCPRHPTPCPPHPASPLPVTPPPSREIKHAQIMPTSAQLTSPHTGHRFTPGHLPHRPLHPPRTPIPSSTSNPGCTINLQLTDNSPPSPRDTIATHHPLRTPPTLHKIPTHAEPITSPTLLLINSTSVTPLPPRSPTPTPTPTLLIPQTPLPPCPRLSMHAIVDCEPSSSSALSPAERSPAPSPDTSPSRSQSHRAPPIRQNRNSMSTSPAMAEMGAGVVGRYDSSGHCG
jgi:hypothetical protein